MKRKNPCTKHNFIFNRVRNQKYCTRCGIKKNIVLESSHRDNQITTHNINWLSITKNIYTELVYFLSIKPISSNSSSSDEWKKKSQHWLGFELQKIHSRIVTICKDSGFCGYHTRCFKLNRKSRRQWNRLYPVEWIDSFIYFFCDNNWKNYMLINIQQGEYKIYKHSLSELITELKNNIEKEEALCDIVEKNAT
jgi:hypothetical protein